MHIKKLSVALMLFTTGVIAQTPTQSLSQTKELQPVSQELEQKTLKLKMPVGVANNSFDLSDSARKAMISSPAMLAISNQIQLTQQDSITMRGLIELPIASLSEVVSKQDYYTQVRLLRFGLLEIQAKPENARLYAAKLYILTDEIFPRKAALDSVKIQAIVEKARQQLQPAPPTSAVASDLEPQPTQSTGWVWMLLVLLLGSGAYYFFFIRKNPGIKTKKEGLATRELTDSLAPSDGTTDEERYVDEEDDQVDNPAAETESNKFN
jgi:hypothetical protein